jgi:hypothetical protein
LVVIRSVTASPERVADPGRAALATNGALLGRVPFSTVRRWRRKTGPADAGRSALAETSAPAAPLPEPDRLRLTLPPLLLAPLLLATEPLPE